MICLRLWDYCKSYAFFKAITKGYEAGLFSSNSAAPVPAAMFGSFMPEIKRHLINN